MHVQGSRTRDKFVSGSVVSCLGVNVGVWAFGLGLLARAQSLRLGFRV